MPYNKEMFSNNFTNFNQASYNILLERLKNSSNLKTFAEKQGKHIISMFYKGALLQKTSYEVKASEKGLIILEASFKFKLKNGEEKNHWKSIELDQSEIVNICGEEIIENLETEE